MQRSGVALLWIHGKVVGRRMRGEGMGALRLARVCAGRGPSGNGEVRMREKEFRMEELEDLVLLLGICGSCLFAVHDMIGIFVLYQNPGFSAGVSFKLHQTWIHHQASIHTSPPHPLLPPAHPAPKQTPKQPLPFSSPTTNPQSSTDPPSRHLAPCLLHRPASRTHPSNISQTSSANPLPIVVAEPAAFATPIDCHGSKLEFGCCG